MSNIMRIENLSLTCSIDGEPVRVNIDEKHNNYLIDIITTMHAGRLDATKINGGEPFKREVVHEV